MVSKVKKNETGIIEKYFFWSIPSSGYSANPMAKVKNKNSKGAALMKNSSVE